MCSDAGDYPFGRSCQWPGLAGLAIEYRGDAIVVSGAFFEVLRPIAHTQNMDSSRGKVCL
jgi:hypothetical protein